MSATTNYCLNGSLLTLIIHNVCCTITWQTMSNKQTSTPSPHITKRHNTILQRAPLSTQTLKWGATKKKIVYKCSGKIAFFSHLSAENDVKCDGMCVFHILSLPTTYVHIE